MSLRHADAFARVATRLRARGFEVDEQPGWRTRGSRGRSLVDVQGVMLHHTVDNPPADYPSLRIVRDGRSDLPGPLAQFGVARSGRILLIAAGLANHAGKTAHGWQQNSRCVGIESANKGTGAEPWPARSMAAQRALVEELGREFGFGASRVVGHKEAAVPRGRKVDPAYDVNAFRASLTFGAAHATPAPAAPTDPKDWYDMASDKDLQRIVDTALEPIKNVLADHTGKLDRIFETGRVTDDRVNKASRSVRAQVSESVAALNLPKDTADAVVNKVVEGLTRAGAA